MSRPPDPNRVAIVGCGVIAPTYAKTISEFGHLELVACADILPERAAKLAADHPTAKATTLEGVLEDPEIDTVVNLTPPTEHPAVTRATLEAGKAAYSEKPLDLRISDGHELVGLAEGRGLRLGCAPDTFLGVGLQTSRAAIDAGLIGEPIAANAFMQQPGPERWHPHPDFFYAQGAGPVFDMAPYYLTTFIQLLGPARRVTASGRMTHKQRVIRAGPRQGELIEVEVPTHVVSVIEFASGAIASLVTSFDVQASRYRNIEVYGTEATLSVPDPNTFGGPVGVRRSGETEWTQLELQPARIPQSRGIGLAEMLWAQSRGRPHRASAAQALHVLEIMDGAIAAAEGGRHVELQTTCPRCEALPVGLAPNTFDD